MDEGVCVEERAVGWAAEWGPFAPCHLSAAGCFLFRLDCS